MKILHTADWHLGNSFHGYDRTEEHRHLLAWLLEQVVQRRPDALLVAGDVFDSPNPSARAEELLYDFLLRATQAVKGLQVVVIAGNHDSAGRLEAPASLLKTLNIYVRGGIRLTEKGEPDFDYYLLPLAELGRDEASCVCMALPFLRGGDYPAGMTPEEGLRFFFEEMHRCLKRSDFAGLPVVAAAHFYAAGASVCEGEHSERLVVGGQDCVDARVVGKGVAYTALGHLHKAQQVAGCPDVCYAGSALPMSFAERGYRHGAQWVELDETGQACVSRIEYNPLRKCLKQGGQLVDLGCVDHKDGRLGIGGAGLFGRRRGEAAQAHCRAAGTVDKKFVGIHAAVRQGDGHAADAGLRVCK